MFLTEETLRSMSVKDIMKYIIDNKGYSELVFAVHNKVENEIKENNKQISK
jgi:hypothetical protein